MSSKKINVVIERGIDGSFSAYIADDNCEFGCIGEGKSVEETKPLAKCKKCMLKKDLNFLMWSLISFTTWHLFLITMPTPSL